MENRRSKAAKAEPGPDVQEVIQGSEEPRRGLMTLLRDLALSLPGAEERNLYDGFCRDWTPAYHLHGRLEGKHVRRRNHTGTNHPGLGLGAGRGAEPTGPNFAGMEHQVVQALH